jgi:ribonuclease III
MTNLNTTDINPGGGIEDYNLKCFRTVSSTSLDNLCNGNGIRRSPTNTSDSFSTLEDEEIVLSTPHITREEIIEILGMRPRNLDFYRRALVHKSIQRNVRKCEGKVLPYLKESNERLEYLGDSVLGLIVAHYLFDKYPNKDEGFLTRTKTKLVCGSNCAVFAEALGLGDKILMSRHVIKINGQKNKKLLEDAFEAFIGAVYKDLGFKFAQAFVVRLIEKHVDFDKILKDNNYKDMFLRYSQSKGGNLPVYKIVKEGGPPHQKVFTVVVMLNDNSLGEGKAKSKKAAEQLAAKEALGKINKRDLEGIVDRDQK